MMNNTQQNTITPFSNSKLLASMFIPLFGAVGFYFLYKKAKEKLGKDVAVQYSHLIKAWQIAYKGYRKQELIKTFDTKKEAIAYAKTKINRKQYTIYVLTKNQYLWAILKKCKTIKVNKA